MKNKKNLTGIIADSHGKPEKIEKALEMLKPMGCEKIFHLGDVCDSMYPETADACVDILIEADILVIKGNNDHAVVINQLGMETGLIRDNTLKYLKNLPHARHWQGADFAHSMPFIKEMGLSAMVGAMGEQQTLLYFLQKPKGLFFRGHSHEPTIAAMSGKKLITRPLEPGKKISLAKRIPCVITCGALTRGYAMVWDPMGQTLKCLSFLE